MASNNAPPKWERRTAIDIHNVNGTSVKEVPDQNTAGHPHLSTQKFTSLSNQRSHFRTVPTNALWPGTGGLWYWEWTLDYFGPSGRNGWDVYEAFGFMSIKYQLTNSFAPTASSCAAYVGTHQAVYDYGYLGGSNPPPEEHINIFRITVDGVNEGNPTGNYPDSITEGHITANDMVYGGRLWGEDPSIYDGAWDEGTTIQVAYNATTGNIWFGDTVSGWWGKENSGADVPPVYGNPSLGTNPTISGWFPTEPVVPYISQFTFANNELTLNFGASAWAGTCPDGFRGWNDIPERPTYEWSAYDDSDCFHYFDPHRLDNDNRTIHNSRGGSLYTSGAMRTSKPVPRGGRVYWEIRLDTDLSIPTFRAGVMGPDTKTRYAVDYEPSSWGAGGNTYLRHSLIQWHMELRPTGSGNPSIRLHRWTSQQVSYNLLPAAPAIGDVWGFAYDIDEGKAWVSVNNSWLVGNPDITSQVDSITSINECTATSSASVIQKYNYPHLFIAPYHRNGTSLSAITTVFTGNFVASDLIYTPPTGFTAIGDAPMGGPSGVIQTHDNQPVLGLHKDRTTPTDIHPGAADTRRYDTNSIWAWMDTFRLRDHYFYNQAFDGWP